MSGLGILVIATIWTSTFELSGTVLQEPGLPLSGARLTLVHEASGQVRTATTTDSGRYHFPSLAPGEYSLEVSANGFATSRYAGLRYFADTKPIFNVTLRLRSVQESLTFTGEAPLVNASQAQVGLSVEDRQLRELPLTRRDYLELIALEGSAREVAETAPGARLVTDAPLISVNGQAAHYTSFELDGYDNTRDQHGVALVDASLEPIEEFRVLSGQFSSEYGHTPVGIVSATTKAGGNDFHGTAFLYVRPGSWDASDPLTGAETALDRQDVGFTFGGPLRRERTHFFTSFAYRNQHEDVVVTAPFDAGRFRGLFELPEDRSRFLGKLSHSFDSTHELVVTAILSGQSALEGVGGFDVFENAVDTVNDDVAVRANLVSDLGSALSEFRVAFASERFQASSGPPPFGAALLHPLLGNIGNPSRFEKVDEEHVEIGQTTSFSKNNHGLKVGFRFVRIGSDSQLDRLGDGAFVFPPEERGEPILFWRSEAPAGFENSLARIESHVEIFVQDDWQVTPFVTASLGARFQKETSVPDNDNFAPRLGIHWDATHDGRTSVRAGYGVFHGFVFSIVDSLERLYGLGGRATFATSFANEAERTIPDYYVTAARRSPRAQHFTFGVEREVMPALSLALEVSHVRGDDLIRPFDENAPVFFDYSEGGSRSALEADATRPDPGLGDRYRLESTGTSRFWGIRLNATKRFARHYMMQAVYHGSRARDDGDDYRVAESLPLDPARPGLEWGAAANDFPHSLVLNGVWEAPWGVRLSGLFRARSGSPVDPRVGRDLDGDRKLRERGVESGSLLERNSYRGPSVATLDLSLGKRFDLGEAHGIETTFDVFNLANRLNPRQVLRTYGTGNVPHPDFLRVVQAAAPRQFQLSIRLLF
ncbi:MAG TPA: TonB-dependent receptor [Vicinamibacteria bacterium]|nr:TonB-dependent receptor [Vicinamibacteria bacterium]